MEEVQHVLKRIMAQKKAASRKKIAQIEQVILSLAVGLKWNNCQAFRLVMKLLKSYSAKAGIQSSVTVLHPRLDHHAVSFVCHLFSAMHEADRLEVQAARDHISTLMSTCSTAIQKEEKAAQAALSKAASQHEAKVKQHEQRLQDAHAAYQAAVAAEWAELQQTISSQAKMLQV